MLSPVHEPFTLLVATGAVAQGTAQLLAAFGVVDWTFWPLVKTESKALRIAGACASYAIGGVAIATYLGAFGPAST